MKKYYKLFFLVIVSIIISGCDATYEINIKNNKITENIKIVETNFELLDKVNDSGWTMRSSFDSLISDEQFSDEIYKISRIDTDKENGLKYKSNYSVSAIKTNLRINECYQNSKVEINDDIVTIETGNDFKCYEYYDNFKTLTVKIKTNHDVINHNAHDVKGNTYIWNITENSDKNIVFEFNKSYKVSKMIYFYISAIVVILTVTIVYVIKRKNKRNNKF